MQIQRIILPLMLILILILCNSCSFIEQRAEREIIWAKLGTPAKVTDKKEVKITDNNANTFNGELVKSDDNLEVIIKTDKGEEKVAKASLRGLIVIDEPTFEYYQALHKAYGAQFLKERNK